jgi:hypothetical protein
VVCSFLVGIEPEGGDGKWPEDLLRKQDEIHDHVKERLEAVGFTVKPGIWMEEGEIIDTVYVRLDETQQPRNRAKEWKLS